MRRPRAARPQIQRSAFAGFRFPPEVITVAVRWYLRYGLSYRDVEERWPSAVSRSTTWMLVAFCRIQRGLFVEESRVRQRVEQREGSSA